MFLHHWHTLCELIAHHVWSVLPWAIFLLTNRWHRTEDALNHGITVPSTSRPVCFDLALLRTGEQDSHTVDCRIGGTLASSWELIDQ
jgi:hypothetical protein